MKHILIVLLLLCSSNAFSKSKLRYHRIALNVYVEDSGERFPLYETQKISKKCYDLMSYEDEVLKEYKDRFYDIKYIEVIVPNTVNSYQQVIIGFRNKSVKNFFSPKFFDFVTPYEAGTSKIFPTNYLVVIRRRLEIPETFLTLRSPSGVWNYVEISKINY